MNFKLVALLPFLFALSLNGMEQDELSNKLAKMDYSSESKDQDIFNPESLVDLCVSYLAKNANHELLKDEVMDLITNSPDNSLKVKLMHDLNSEFINEYEGNFIELITTKQLTPQQEFLALKQLESARSHLVDLIFDIEYDPLKRLAYLFLQSDEFWTINKNKLIDLSTKEKNVLLRSLILIKYPELAGNQQEILAIFAEILNQLKHESQQSSSFKKAILKNLIMQLFDTFACLKNIENLNEIFKCLPIELSTEAFFSYFFHLSDLHNPNISCQIEEWQPEDKALLDKVQRRIAQAAENRTMNLLNQDNSSLCFYTLPQNIAHLLVNKEYPFDIKQQYAAVAIKSPIAHHASTMIQIIKMPKKIGAQALKICTINLADFNAEEITWSEQGDYLILRDAEGEVQKISTPYVFLFDSYSNEQITGILSVLNDESVNIPALLVGLISMQTLEEDQIEEGQDE